MKIKTNNHDGLRTWVEISKKAIIHNLKIFRSLISSETKLMAIVKSNAYGHSLTDFSSIADMAGADWFGVDSLVEGLALRKNGIKKPILVLGYTLPERLEEAGDYNISLTISNVESLNRLIKLKNPINIHLKIDTGMHRQGFLTSELDNVCKKIKASKIELEGIYTHFASAKNPSFPQDTDRQIEIFNQAIQIVEDYGFRPIKHACATAGTLLFPKARYDMVRVGIGLYGMWPSKETMRAISPPKFFGRGSRSKHREKNKIRLEPVLSWKTIVGEVKILPEGGRVGYDFTEKLLPGSKIAICPIGYWHGFTRSFSSIGHVLVGGERAKILGRVSMDMIVIDTSKIKNVRVGDEVVIIGQQARPGRSSDDSVGGAVGDKNEITADEMADISGTINYEVVTRINPLIKRIVI